MAARRSARSPRQCTAGERPTRRSATASPLPPPTRPLPHRRRAAPLTAAGGTVGRARPVRRPPRPARVRRAGSARIADNVGALAGGLDQLAGGTDQSATARASSASGATQLAGGIDEAGAGATSLADGVAQLATGTTTLADGLDQASAAVPSYTDERRDEPRHRRRRPGRRPTASAHRCSARPPCPLLATLALWFGGLGTFVALQAASRRALTSRAPSAVLALRGLAPAAALGAVQGLLVAGVVQLAASYDWGQWSLFAALCVLAGVAFAAVNQALVAVFGGAGRWLAALVGVLAVATGVVSTVPGRAVRGRGAAADRPRLQRHAGGADRCRGPRRRHRGAADLVGPGVHRDDARGGAAPRGAVAGPARGIAGRGVTPRPGTLACHAVDPRVVTRTYGRRESAKPSSLSPHICRPRRRVVTGEPVTRRTARRAAGTSSPRTGQLRPE